LPGKKKKKFSSCAHHKEKNNFFFLVKKSQREILFYFLSLSQLQEGKINFELFTPCENNKEKRMFLKIY